ncbi:SpoIIE family protein phosphatase [Fluviispira multicolorata]|uniref:SpoIIE family protein phosphatase n=1 Tax=Fluviispira multicolorata TaxID=2654512 RepID=A0A833JA63_9BACT|nr:SpoIIE family protein phosphatase [Fluviispira multicolorata]KAB8027391.1 SpoIIE family protein phosphatase [Fluviispira multicolorata]
MSEKIINIRLPLTVKIASSLIFIIFFVVSIYTYFDIKRTRTQMELDAKKNTLAAFTSAIPIIENGIWGLDITLIETTLKQVLKNPIVDSVLVFDESGKVFATFDKDADGRSYSLNNYLNDNDIQNINTKKENSIFEKKIKKEEKVIIATALYSKENHLRKETIFKIGYFVMTYSTQNITEIINETITKSILLSFLLGVVIIITSFLYIRQLIILPLTELEKSSLKIAKNEFIQTKKRKSYIGEDEIDSLINNFNLMVIQIIKFIAEQKEQQRMANELEMARIVQESLIPNAKNLRVGHFELSSYFKAASECGGDWWHFYPLANKKILIMLGDVTGHGTPSGMLTAAVKGYCDSIYSKNEINPAKILEELDIVVRLSGDKNRLMTMFAAIISPIDETITFANAAHNFPFLIKKDSDKNQINITTLVINGKRLGYLNKNLDEKEIIYEVNTKKFSTGDILFVFSDGLVEAKNKDKQEYSERRLRKLLTKFETKNTSEMIEEISLDLKNFAQDEIFDDDVSFVFCKMCSDEDTSYSHEMLKYFEKDKNKSLDSDKFLKNVS